MLDWYPTRAQYECPPPSYLDGLLQYYKDRRDSGDQYDHIYLGALEGLQATITVSAAVLAIVLAF